MTTPSPIDALCVNTLRTLAIDAIQKANSGHPGLPMGAAPMAYVLWQRHLRHNPAAPRWADRDRFVLSAGHGSMLLYALLHLTGDPLSLDDLKQFRQWESKTPGHPESFMTLGVEATTGPLGQGCANAVGMAIAERALAHRYNRDAHEIVNHHTFALVGDGDLMEGISAEAASLAGHLKLGKLICLYDSNDISLDGPTDLAYTEDLAKRYEAYGWQVLKVEDGNTDLAAIDAAIRAAKQDTSRPSMIVVKTTIGYGSPNKQGSSDAHGSPLGAAEIELAKRNLGWPESEPFAVPGEVLGHYRQALERGGQAQSDWEARFAAYRADFPELAAEFEAGQRGELPTGWNANLPSFPAGGKMATRASSGAVLNALAAAIPTLIGGDADLSCSTKTLLKGGGDFDGQTGKGRNIRFGVREHAMGAIANGIVYHGGLKTFTATFFCFADYMRPAMRLASLSGLNPVYVFTHDSVAVGEDGPTHQPVEHLASLRAMPNHLVLRPADATETAVAWQIALEQTSRPTSLVFSRQDVPHLDRAALASAEGVRRGGYILAEAEGQARIVLIATGTEVALALEGRLALQAQGIPTRVVSLPSFELFADQSPSYRSEVLGAGVPRLAIEAGVSFGWERWLGDRGAIIAIDRFGASAPGEQVLEELGFNVPNVIAQAKALLD